MKFTILGTAEQLAERAAGEIVRRVRAKPSAVLILPTGNTPLRTYARIVEVTRRDSVDWSHVRIVTLDEYADIPRDDPRVLGAWLEREIVGPLGIDAERFIRFDPAGDPIAECVRMEAWVARNGPADLAILGLGLNGHLGFNEPGTSFASSTHHLPLTPESIASNAVYWGGQANVPRTAFTLGLATLAGSRSIMLLVSGASKAAILKRCLQGPVGPEVPATALRAHADAMVLADRPAAAELSGGRTT